MIGNMIVFAFAVILAQITSSFGDPKINVTKQCIPTSSAIGPCHVCVCTIDGVYHCRRIPCEVGGTRINGENGNNLPEIKEGDPCDPGKMYRMDCNKCQCTNNGKLLCTKMLCYDSNDYNQSEVLRSQKRRSGDLPKAPKGPCIPGIVYQNGCNHCFCDDKEKIHCGTGKCDLEKRVLYPNDLHEPFTDDEFKALETRVSFSSECTPGKAYRVNCDLCLCNEMKSLICENSACLSFEGPSVNRMTAYEFIGKKCNGNETIKVENKCLTCSCVKGITECNWQNTCEDNAYVEKMKTTIKKQKIDPEKDNCLPGALYLLYCNRCHCMMDAALRCTQMTCLNYAQASKVRNELEHLERNGL